MLYKKYFACFFLSVFFLYPLLVRAEPQSFFEWHTTNIQLLKGWDYKIGDEDRTIVTLEHANGWKYGDFHMFVDGTRFDRGGSNIYAEFSPRLSFSKVTGKSFSFGIIKDVLASFNIEEGEKSTRTWLGGGAVDLNIPGFKYFKVNLYLRDDTTRKGETYQLSLAWNRPFSISGTRYLIEGFADFAGAEGRGKENHQLIVPRFLVNASDIASVDLGNLWAGMEYSHWRNKFGNDGITESVPQIQFKWVF